MDKEHFDALASAIANAGSAHFTARLMDAVCPCAQFDHLAIDVARGPDRQKFSEGVSVTSSIFPKVASSSTLGRRLSDGMGGQRPGVRRRVSVRRLNLEMPDLRSRERDFYLRFGIVDGVELHWRNGHAVFHLDLYRTHRLGRLSNSEEAVLSAAAGLMANLVELHVSLSQLALAATADQREDVLEIIVGLLGEGLTPREKAVACRIASGMGTEDIARDMGVMPATVITFRKRVYAKLGIGSRAELFARCFQLLLTAEGRSLSIRGPASPVQVGGSRCAI
jgi:DNA-binding CsgD family transcriptional regulator